MNSVTENIEDLFPPLGRHAFLDAEAVKRLVREIRPGEKCQGNVEKARNGTWRLRVTVSLAKGKRVRRGITLPDDAAAEWVRDYISTAKQKRIVEAERAT